MEQAILLAKNFLIKKDIYDGEIDDMKLRNNAESWAKHLNYAQKADEYLYAALILAGEYDPEINPYEMRMFKNFFFKE